VKRIMCVGRASLLSALSQVGWGSEGGEWRSAGRERSDARVKTITLRSVVEERSFIGDGGGRTGFASASSRFFFSTASFSCFSSAFFFSTFSSSFKSCAACSAFTLAASIIRSWRTAFFSPHPWSG
jgi:hypothetical protein